MNDIVEKTEGSVGEIVLYQPDEKTSMKVRLDATFDTVWLTQQQIAELFGVQKAAISKHMKNIFSSCELTRERVVSKMETTASDGKKYQVWVIGTGSVDSSESSPSCRFLWYVRAHTLPCKPFAVN